MNREEFQIMLGQLAEVMAQDGENGLIAETYHDILTQSAEHLTYGDWSVEDFWDDRESLLDDTIGRALMFIELADNGESETWEVTEIPLRLIPPSQRGKA